MAKSWRGNGGDKFTRKQQKNSAGKGRRTDTWEDDEVNLKNFEPEVPEQENMREQLTDPEFTGK